MKLLHLEYREEALVELKNHFFALLNKDFYRHILAFQAPTGSGKTVTMACLLRDIVNELPLAQPTVSQHLKELKNAGIIKGEIEGNSICYCIEPQSLIAIQTFLGDIFNRKAKSNCC